MSQNDMSGFSQIRHNERPHIMQDELSSPEVEENLQPYRQESQTENEPSSSSMSGYDLKGMFSKATKHQKDKRSDYRPPVEPNLSNIMG